MKRCWVFLGVAMMVGGCIRTYPLVGTFPQSNEVFDGEVTSNIFTGHADMRVQTHVSGVTGRGYAQVTHVPYNTLTGGGEVKGQRGIFEVNCEDGRLVKGKWVAETLTSGYGWGEDQYGNPVRFTFGMKRKDVPAMVEAELAKAAKRPALPPAGVPTTQPVLIREVQK